MSLSKGNNNVTAEFTVLFYENLIDKKSPLQMVYLKTQREIAKKHPDPYFWASFVLIQ
ncbi:hypothetical protein [Mariniflexile sp. AS56]|uniref:hypothetical protein n=1 Tax=Mariniflexile sp. AS56 TaxID=3063957 RepID=UPI0034E9891C